MERFAVVGIGSSAGGLNALKSLFAAVKTPCDMAFVVVPHLDPNHKSLLVELLSSKTTMPVMEAQHGAAIEKNTVYVIPPNRFMSLESGRLQLSPLPDAESQVTAIDFFLCSLAIDCGNMAIGIILSGTGSHGVSGIREIKRCGGMVIAQSFETAEFDSMPRNAVATGLVDFVLAPENIPQALVNLSLPEFGGFEQASESQPNLPFEEVKQVLELIRAQTKSDFTAYRRNMLERRLDRRMGIIQIPNLSQYLVYLRSHPEEVVALSKDFLIGVTSFFREPDAFAVLSTEVIDKLVENQVDDIPIRIWVPSCATGEEAYTIAILALEAFRKRNKAVQLQIFASDINEHSIEHARRGVFPSSIVKDLSTERLKEFFSKINLTHYQVSRQLRETIVFSHQNLISDTPFSRLDLISCRNLLIYIEPSIQKRMVDTFHFAIKENGYLFLGPSESILRSTNQFDVVSKKWRLFRRIGHSRSQKNSPSNQLLPSNPKLDSKRSLSPEKYSVTDIKELFESLILREYAPAAAIVNRRFEILYVMGPLSDFLELPVGAISKDLLSMARPGLQTKLRTTVLRAMRDESTAIEPYAHLLRNGVNFKCQITVRPIHETSTHEGLLLVLFCDLGAIDIRSKRGTGSITKSIVESQATDQVRQLEIDLTSLKSELDNSHIEMESSNEELKASNEEIMSMNEELQSANEELESSKEELQTLVEELSKVNSQLLGKIAELDRSNSDMSNLMTNTEIATIFLDEKLVIQRFTPSTVSLLHLVNSDTGRNLRDFAPRFKDVSMLEDCQKVLANNSVLESEVTTDEEKCYLRRILPYRDRDNHVVGVVITFVDITQRKIQEASRREGELRFRKIFENTSSGIAITDWTGNFQQCNPAYYKLVGYSEEELSTIQMKSLLHPDDFSSYDAGMNRLQLGQISSYECEGRYIRKDRVVVSTQMFCSPLLNELGQASHVVTLVTNTSELKRAVADLRESVERMRAIHNAASDAIITILKTGLIESVNGATETMFGYQRDELIGKRVTMLMPMPFSSEHDGYLNRFHETGEARIIGIGREVLCRRKDGSTFPADLAVSQVDHLGLFTGILREITSRKEMQKHILEIAADEQRRIGQELHDGTQQELTGLSLFAGSLVEMIRDASSVQKNANEGWQLDEAMFERVRKIVSLISQGLVTANRHVRELAHGIMPVQIDAEGLQSALRELASSTDAHDDILCRFECTETIEINDNTTASHLYRIAQEAINNSIRHGQAHQIVVSLTQNAEQIVLEVRDDGVGMDQDKMHSIESREKGMGLRTMEYRANLIGGLLQFENRAEGGTSLRCIILIKQ
jgi:two-component system CheB/CheR fusion protein